MTPRHCLYCDGPGWHCCPRGCRGEVPRRRPWLLRPGWVQEVVVLLALPWLALHAVLRRRRGHDG